jgi:hypothetical protein
MSDINKKLQAAPNVELLGLGGLAARSNLEAAGSLPANDADLASACISPQNVMRVSQRSSIRNGVDHTPLSQHAQVELTNGRSRTSAQTSTSAGASHSSGRPANGILRNPFYRYDGGLLNKVLALIGNILKALERLVLRLLGARDSVAPSGRPQQSTKQTTAGSEGSDPKQAQELEREERRKRREQSELLVKRQ